MRNENIIEATHRLAVGYVEWDCVEKQKGVCEALDRVSRGEDFSTGNQSLYGVFKILMGEGRKPGRYWFGPCTEENQSTRFIALCLLDAYIESDGFNV